MKSLLLLVLVSFSITAFSQIETFNNAAVKQDAFPKIVTRAVIIADNKNLLLQVPALETSFINILLNGIKTEAIKAYSGDNDSLILTPKALTELLKVDTSIGFATLIPDSVTKLIIKEEWTVQWDRGRMVIRITGIAPIIRVMDTTGIIQEKPAFWLRYTDIRDFLATQKIKSNLKKGKPQNLRDVIDGRYFSSEVVSVSKKL